MSFHGKTKTESGKKENLTNSSSCVQQEKKPTQNLISGGRTEKAHEEMGTKISP
jgi:hypothetical protein